MCFQPNKVLPINGVNLALCTMSITKLIKDINNIFKLQDLRSYGHSKNVNSNPTISDKKLIRFPLLAWENAIFVTTGKE